MNRRLGADDDRVEVQPLTPPNPANPQLDVHVSRWRRALLWTATTALFCTGWLMLGAAGLAGARPTQAALGVVLLVVASALALRLKRKLTVIRFLAIAFGAMVISPFVLIGVILFVVYPLAALLGGS